MNNDVNDGQKGTDPATCRNIEKICNADITHENLISSSVIARHDQSATL
jgi:hypothetical protein